MVAVEALVGRQVVRVRRLFYVLPEGTVRGDRGDLELTYSENGIVRLGVGADGEVLRVDEAPWQAPFELPLSATNAEFVRRSGKWVPFDVTGGPPYSQLVARITSADPVRQGEKVVGVALATETNAVVEVICDGDETWVRFRAA